MVSGLSDLWVTFWGGSAKLTDYAPLMHVAFQANIAYAILLKAGQLQGRHLASFAHEQGRKAQVAYQALSSEGQVPSVKPDGDSKKALDIVGKAQELFSARMPKYGVVSLVFAVANIILLFSAAIFADSFVKNWLLSFLEIVLLSPIPTGLVWTHLRCREFEQEITKIYDRFFEACDHLANPPSAEIQTMLTNLRAELNLPRPGLLSRLLSND